MKLLVLVFTLFLSLLACNVHKETQSSAHSDMTSEHSETVTFVRVSDLSALLNSDRNVVLSGDNISIHHSSGTFVDSVDPQTTTLSIDRIDVKDKKFADIKGHDKLAGSADIDDKTVTSNLSERNVTAKADVFHPPALLIILAVPIVIGVLIFTFRLLHRFLQK